MGGCRRISLVRRGIDRMLWILAGASGPSGAVHRPAHLLRYPFDVSSFCSSSFLPTLLSARDGD